jgi:hypothetical protein
VVVLRGFLVASLDVTIGAAGEAGSPESRDRKESKVHRAIRAFPERRARKEILARRAIRDRRDRKG